MVKSKIRRLKVYQAHLGFYETVVAAPNRTAALRAWGTHQDLFAGGEAREASDPQAVAAALAHPETPLRRGVGTDDPFSLDPKPPRLPVGPLPKPKAAAAPTTATPKAARKPVPPDRSALTAAEAAIRTLDDLRRREEADFRARREAIEHEAATAAQAYRAARAQADATLERARQAYVKAGGRVQRAPDSG